MVASDPTPWYPNDLPSDTCTDPVVSSGGSRGSMNIFSSRRGTRDADHYELAPADLTGCDALELQDDSFVNFSVGNLHSRNFSVLGVARYVRGPGSSRAGAFSSDPGSSTDSVDGEKNGWKLWKARKTNAKLKRGDSFLSPVKKCFY